MLQNVAIFIDFWNLNKSFDKLKDKKNLSRNSKIHFEKLSDFTTAGKNVFLKNIYLARPPGNNGFNSFIYSMQKAGLNTIIKPVKIIKMEDGSEKRKGDFDVEIAVDIYELLAYGPPCNEIILYSGDSDFARLAQVLKNHDVKFTIVSTLSHISSELSKVADKLIMLDDIREDFYVM